MQETKKKFGGAQEGSGRKPTGPAQTPRLIKVNNELDNRLENRIQQTGQKRNRLYNQLLKSALDRLDAIEKAALEFDDLG